ncbi:MAG: hypothetical protein ACXWDI_11950 [Nocardioides sp.]
MNSSTAADRGVASAALAALLWAALAMGLLVGGYGLLLIGIDLSAQGEDWDGLGILFGSMLAVPALVVSCLAWVALRGARRRTGGGRGTAVVLGMLLVVPILLAPGTALRLVPMVVGIGLVGVAVLGGRSEGPS